MGQTIGKARIRPGAIPFTNLPYSLVSSLSQSVYEVAEGFGLDEDELKKIIQISLHEYFSRLSESSIDECADALFALFNVATLDSKEALIDSFEFLATICIVSGMQLDEKIQFIFDLFDFNESGKLNINEVTLAFRSIASGTSKISASSAPIDIDVIDKVALEGFELSMPDNLKYSQAISVEDHNLDKQVFFNYVSNCAETMSLLDEFDDIFVEESIKPGACQGDESAKLVPLRFHTEVNQNTSTDEAWRDQLRFLPCSSGEEISQSPPIDGLALDWIYGRNAATPAMYCSNGDMIYAAGSTVVKITNADEDNAMQEFFMGHAGHVTSIDVFKADGNIGDVVASADNGSESKICVWSSSTLSSIATIPCFHQSGISKLNFSLSGELLLSLRNDDLHSVAVYKWRDKRILFTTKVEVTEVYDCKFLSSDNSFAMCTRDAVFFWTRFKSNVPYSKHRGFFNRLSTREVMTSIGCIGDTIITGSSSGHLWIWEGRVCTKLVEALRSGPITQLHAPRGGYGLCVSTHGGSVHLLKDNLEIHHRLVPNKGLGDSDRIIDTICWHPGIERVLVGQNGGALYQMNVCNEEDVKVVTNGHSDMEGISIRNDNIITVGKNRIKLWDTKTHGVLQESCIEATLSCVSYNIREDQIAVGFGTDGARSSLEKSFAILNGDDLQIIHQGCNSLNSLTCCNFSNDGKLVAFGSADTSIYIHHCTEKEFQLLAKARGHHSSPISIDFGCDKGSDNAAFLRSNSISGESMFWTTRGKLRTPLSQRDTVWESESCIFSAFLEGAHNSYDGHGSKVASCSPFSKNEDQSILVGDSSGSLRVFRASDIQQHQVATRQPLFLEYNGHSGSIQSIQVLEDVKAVYTMSRVDSCLFQWKHTTLSWDQGLPSAPLRNKPRPHLQSNESSPLEMQAMIDQMDNLDFSKKKETTKNDVVYKPRPWTRSIVAPTRFVPSDGPLPDSQITIERIHGYSGNGVRNNLHYLSRGNNMIYNIGKVLVRYDLQEDKQQFFLASGEITCLSVYQKSLICAVGQEEASPAVIIVDLSTMKPISLLNGHAKGLVCLDFDDSGNFVVSVCTSQEIVVHDWKNGAVIASCRTYGLETLDVEFLRGSSTLFVECGKCFVRFWRVAGCSLRSVGDEVKLESLQNHTQYYSCIGWNGDDNLLVGTSSGHVIQLVEKKPHNRIKAHQSAVAKISSAKDGFFTCSDDSFKHWSSSMRCLLSINTQSLGTKHQISSICWANDMILVGTSGDEIWQLSSDDGSNLNGEGRALMSSHSSSPAGLSVHPNGTFATCGEDGFLRVWNVYDHQESLSFDLGMPARSCAFAPDAHCRMVAVGFGKPAKDNARTINGKWIILNISEEGDFQIISERRDSRKFITEIKWHSNGDRLAVGSWDKKICVYQLTTETKPATKVDIILLSMMDLISPPNHFDFSRDGKYLRANYECNELHFFEAGPGLHIKEPSRLKDTLWETETCVFGWNVQGVWLRGDATEIVSLDCSTQDCPSIVSGDSSGNLRMHQFPCTSASAQFITYPAHLGSVGKVRWVPGGYIVSTGEKDNAVVIWRQEVDEGFGDRTSVVGSTADFDEANDSTEIDDATCHSALYDFVGHVIYPSSGNCIIFDKRRHCQDHHESYQHEATVSAICISHSRQLVASSHNETIILWDSQCLNAATILTDDHQEHNISTLSFSPDDSRLVSVSSDGHKQIICVWIALNREWNDACLHLHTLAGHERVHFCHFAATSPSRLVSGGRHHVNVWSEQHSTLMVSKRFIEDTVLCGVSVEEKLITGTKSGALVVWEGKKAAREIQAHNDGVLSLCACPEGLVSGCHEGVVVLWSKTFQKVASFDIAKASPCPSQPAICSVDITPHLNGESTMKILVRTLSGEILEISCVTENIHFMCKAGCEFANAGGSVPSVASNPANQVFSGTLKKIVHLTKESHEMEEVKPRD